MPGPVRTLRGRVLAVTLAIAVVQTACAPGVRRRAVEDGAPTVTHGPMAGEVAAGQAVLWARCDRSTTLSADVDGRTVGRVAAERAHDLVGRLVVDGLRPGTTHRYAVRCGDGPAAGGTFRTAPGAEDAVPVRFAWAGDVGGQNVCRDRVLGYPGFAAVAAYEPDFLIGLGDLIYADDPCLAIGRLGNAQVPGPPRASDLAGYRRHWRYLRDEAAQRALLARTAYYAVWDDHEVGDDFGPVDDPTRDDAGRRLLRDGRTAFVEWNPFAAADATRLWRRARWGRHVEVFLLDTRSERDRNAVADDAARPKTLLGAAQRAWLVDGIASSTATWKVVASSVPLAVPTGGVVRDGWADGGGPTGFEREATALLRELARRRVRGLLWIAADVHFATAFRHRPFDDEPAFTVHEVVSGPLNAGIYPRDDVDPTLRPERLLFHGPPTPPRDLATALGWFNFGLVRVDAAGGLAVEVIDATGRVRQRLVLPPPAADGPPGHEESRSSTRAISSGSAVVGVSSSSSAPQSRARPAASRSACAPAVATRRATPGAASPMKFR